MRLVILGVVVLLSGAIAPNSKAQTTCDPTQQKTDLNTSTGYENIFRLSVFYCTPAQSGMINIHVSNSANKWISVVMNDEIGNKGRYF